MNKLGFATISLQENYSDTIYLKNLMNDESWRGRGDKVLVVILYVGHLEYDKLKQNCEISNFMNLSLDALSNNIKQIIFQCDKFMSLFR